MVTREKIVEEIKKVPNEDLEELYVLIKKFEKKNNGEEATENVMAKLRNITISAPSDFSIKANLHDLESDDAQ